MSEQELRSIASQLSCPSGEVGLEVGNKMNELNEFITRKTIEAFSAQETESIVEIGPGNGCLSLPLIDAIGVDGHYCGIEMSDAMAAELNRTLSNTKCNVDVVYGDCLEVNLETESVDGILGVNVLYFIEDLGLFFRHISDWLKVGGRAVFGIRSDTALKGIPFTQYGFNIRTTDEIKSFMNEAGFGFVKSFRYDEGMSPFGDTMIPVDSVIIVGEKIQTHK